MKSNLVRSYSQFIGARLLLRGLVSLDEFTESMIRLSWIAAMLAPGVALAVAAARGEALRLVSSIVSTVELGRAKLSSIEGLNKDACACLSPVGD